MHISASIFLAYIVFVKVQIRGQIYFKFGVSLASKLKNNHVKIAPTKDGIWGEFSAHH